MAAKGGVPAIRKKAVQPTAQMSELVRTVRHAKKTCARMYLPIASSLRGSVEELWRDVCGTSYERARARRCRSNEDCRVIEEIGDDAHMSPSGERYAEPKSVSLILILESSKTFSGFMSRCTIPLLWIQSIVSTIWAVYHRAHRRDKEPNFLTRSARSPLGARSSTKSLSTPKLHGQRRQHTYSEGARTK